MLNDRIIKIDQAQGLRDKLTQHSAVKVIAVTAGKGGVGKTNVSVNVSIALAKKGHKVMLLDGDLGLANIDVMLGLHAKYNLSHVLDGTCQLDDIFIEGPNGVMIVPGASGTDAMTKLSMTEHAGIINAFNEISNKVDYLIVDTAAGISDTVLSFTRSSQEVLVVLCDEPTSLTDAYALIKVMHRRYGSRHFHVVANMVRTSKEGRNLFNKLYKVADQFLDVTLDYMGAIPFDELVHQAVKLQKPLLNVYPSASASKEFKALADKISQWPLKKEVTGNTGFFLDRLVMAST